MIQKALYQKPMAQILDTCADEILGASMENKRVSTGGEGLDITVSW